MTARSASKTAFTIGPRAAQSKRFSTAPVRGSRSSTGTVRATHASYTPTASPGSRQPRGRCENERAARNEAEAASRLKDEFLAIVSHELRTPLTAILGWSQLLLVSEIAGAELRTGLETIRRSARSQAQIIDDLLDMSRIITGKIRLDIQTVDLSQVLGPAPLRGPAGGDDLQFPPELVDPADIAEDLAGALRSI